MESLATSAMDNKDVERLELLKQSFGDKLFKCKYPRCDSYIEGFATKKERDSHINQHLRPFKCEVQTCFYSTIGFAKSMELENHMAEKHQTDIGSPDLSDLLPMLTIAEPDNPDFHSADMTALLFDAISIQNADAVRDCLAQTPDLHKRNEEGMCVLQHCTTMGGSVEIAELLINAGAQADGNLQLPFPSNIRIRSTPLFMAAELGHEAMVRLLLEKGANPEIYNQYGKLPWYSAANRGDETTAILILKKQLERSTNAQTIDWLRTTSFVTAVEEGYGAIVSFLSEEAFDINTKNRDGNSALFCAAAQNRETTIRILLDNGADIETTNDRSVTPLIGAARAGYRAVVQILLDRGANIEAKNILGQTPLANALHSLSSGPPSPPSSDLLLEVIQLLLDNGANLDAETGQRALFKAARYGSEPLVRLLLQKGIHPKAGTMLMAARLGHEEIIRLLLSNGGDANETGFSSGLDFDYSCDFLNEFDFDYHTPLESAVMRGHEGVVRLLLQNGANRESGVGALRETIESGKSSFKIAQLLLDGIHPVAGTLCLAVEQGDEDMVRLLLEKGSDINEINEINETPLEGAVNYNRIGITRLLLEKGVNPNSKSTVGSGRRTILYLAVNKGFRDSMPIVQLLLSHGADPRAESPSGKPICSLGAWKKMVKWGVPDVKDEPTTNPNVMQE
jgi:ankyrin repeat protein